MKKFIITLVSIFVLVIGGGIFWYKSSYGGHTYYVQITEEGDRKTDKDSRGNVYGHYEYNLDGKDKDGKKQNMTFGNLEDRPMKRDAWIKVTYNKVKGVTSWEEVEPSKVPDKAK
ncbi:hypothetical protein BG261_09950 [Floricoccus tropicus]|uniref:YxeA family protein n=1 Tax=Floricoccus tropicus TaxID=1859473 RepID=A0A1E8GR40_9LACT|nr:YxeA family protein [Floricoccus tropicus]OFI49958.1 hypothetical protein BG261_09950 [Floricoccus tropicus]